MYVYMYVYWPDMYAYTSVAISQRESPNGVDPNLLSFTTTWLVDRVFANGPGDLGSIPGHVIPKILKMILDTSILYT